MLSLQKTCESAVGPGYQDSCSDSHDRQQELTMPIMTDMHIQSYWQCQRSHQYPGHWATYAYSSRLWS